MTFPTALLTTPEYCGTLAATRSLGARGIEVWSAGPDLGAPAAQSRFVRRKLLAPSMNEPEQLLEWMVEHGTRHPGSVLYPTSDDVAWFQAVHAQALAPHYCLYAPVAECYEKLLDKRLLHDLCAKVGIDTPLTYFPENEAEVERVAAEVDFPLLLKQRTQVLSSSHSKGKLLTRREELLPAYREFIRDNTHHPLVQARMPNVSFPMLQSFHSEAASNSYMLAGFIDRSGKHVAGRAAIKVLQRPKTLGIALCLESAPVDEVLLEKVAELCRQVGYFGVFQIDFLQVGGRKLLIDVNPRYYHYMAFDLARGLDLAYWAQLGACGRDEELARAIDAAGSGEATHLISGFTYRLQLYELLFAQTLAGTMPLRESLSWKRWYDGRRHELIDAVEDKQDPRPAWVDAARHLLHRVSHPRSFIRQVALDR